MRNNNLAAPQRKFETQFSLHIRKACREFSYKIDRIASAIGVILALSVKNMFYVNKKSEVPPKNS
jgi:hypothetical protein